MNHNDEELHDPKGQGQPPPYAQNNPPQQPQMMQPQMMQPTYNNMMPMGQTMHVGVGPSVHVGMGVGQTYVGMGQTMHVGVGQNMHMGHTMAVGVGPTMTVMGQPSGMMYTQPVVMPMVVGNQMSPKPVTVSCPSCKEEIVTRVEPKATARTHVFAFMFLIMCCLPCVLIPYCTDSCRNMDHYCPNCNAYIGSHVS